MTFLDLPNSRIEKVAPLISFAVVCSFKTDIVEYFPGGYGQRIDGDDS